MSRDGFGYPIPRQPTHSPFMLNLELSLLTGFLLISAAASIYLYRHMSSGQSRLYRVTQLRTDGVHCLEFVGTWPVVLKVFSVTGAVFARSHHRPINVRLSFPTPTIGMWWNVRCMIQEVLEVFDESGTSTI